MTEPNRGNDAELIERMERGVDAGSEDEAAARGPYQRLIERIGDLDVVEPPPGWVERAVERWERTTVAPRGQMARRWAAWGGLAAALTAAALIVLVPRCRDGGERDRFDVVVMADGTARSGDAVIGDALALHAPRPRTGVLELRLYRDRVLIARCPGDARCVETARQLALSVTIDRPGTYQAVAITWASAPPAPAGGLELDLLEAHTAAAHIERKAPVDAR